MKCCVSLPAEIIVLTSIARISVGSAEKFPATISNSGDNTDSSHADSHALENLNAVSAHQCSGSPIVVGLVRPGSNVVALPTSKVKFAAPIS